MAGQLTDGEIARVAEERLRASAAVKEALTEPARLAEIAAATRVVVDALVGGGKVMFFGNGGSAADAQHLAGEFVGRFLVQRRAVPALALNANTSVLTAVANDLGYDVVFSRQVEALGRPGDAAIGISTSGESANVVAGLGEARRRGLATVALTGRSGGAMAELADVCVRVPADETPRVQEGQLVVGHIICELAEREIVSADST